MLEHVATAHAQPDAQTSRWAAERAWRLAGEPSPEAVAAIVAVLSLMQSEAPSGTAAPRTSAWAQAGRREAIRPWTRRQ